LTQNFSKSKEERIKNIEQHLHAHKIHVAISVQNFWHKIKFMLKYLKEIKGESQYEIEWN